MWKSFSGVLCCLVCLQWIIISTLLLRQQNEHEATLLSPHNTLIADSPSLGSKKCSDNLNLRAIESSKVSSSLRKNNLQEETRYEGVAATLMINSPKWFQRRYTYMINNVLANIPDNWALQIFYAPTGQSQFGLDINPGLSRLNQSQTRVKFTEIPIDLVSKFGMKRKFHYWTSQWMWESMLAEKVLVFNGNGAICSNANMSLLDGSATKFLSQFDYIGAPWKNMYGLGGDGSISYRNATVMLEAIKFKGHDGKSSEDYYFIQTLSEMNKSELKNYRIASKEQTQLFGGIPSTLDKVDAPPFVISGTLPRLDHGVRELVLELCPEAKIIFPSLHNPNCFGAHPDAQQCSIHICALKDPKLRPSGC